MSEPITNLTNCDREPIHIPGSIQPHGALLSCDINAVTVLRHSENAAARLGIDGEIENRPLAEIVGDRVAHDLRNALATSSCRRAEPSTSPRTATTAPRSSNSNRQACRASRCSWRAT